MRFLALLLLAGMAQAFDDPGAPATRPAGSKEVSELQDYTRNLSKDWLNRFFRIDLDAIGARLKRRAREYTEVNLERTDPGAAPEPGVPGNEPVLYAVSLRLEQYDDLMRVTRDPQDIPFALRLDAEGRILGETLALQTRLFVPLSWKDELRAEAVIPFPEMNIPLMTAAMQGIGFDSPWAFKSTYSNRLGLSSVSTGLGTQWLKLWNFQYDYRVRFGQDVSEQSHWLKLERSF